jgi:hypothetical protein
MAFGRASAWTYCIFTPVRRMADMRSRRIYSSVPRSISEATLK